MDVSLYSAMSAAKQFDQMQAISSNNIANANTDNFKADQASFKTVYLNGATAAGSTAYTELSSLGVDLNDGSINHTNKSNDVVAGGGGYFSVLNESGDTVISRSVTINKNNAGILSDNRGRLIIGDSGGTITVGNSPFWIDVDGTIKGGASGQESYGKLQVISVTHEDVEKSETGELILNGEANQSILSNTSVLVGHLETSNVDTITEMTRLMTSQRNYEMSTKMINSIKGLHSASNNLIGD